MKTVKHSLLAVCLLFLLSLVSSATCIAGHTQTSPCVAPAGDSLADDDAITADSNDFDFEQYAYEDGSDEEPVTDGMDDDSDLEPAPEPDAPAPGDDGEMAEPGEEE